MYWYVAGTTYDDSAGSAIDRPFYYFLGLQQVRFVTYVVDRVCPALACAPNDIPHNTRLHGIK